MESLGGMQRVAVDLHAALDAHPDVLLFDRVLRGSWKWRHVNAARFLTGSFWIIPYMIEHHQIDVVVFSSMVTAAASLPIADDFRRANCRTVVIAHGLDVVTDARFYQKWIVPRVFRMVDAVAPVSRATAAACAERGLPENKIHVVPNGISPDRFSDVTPDEKGLRALGGVLPEGAFLLCSLGRHVERKGFHWFVDEVMPRLPDHIYYWIGGEGETTSLIQEAIIRRELGERVRLLGRIPYAQVKALYHTADCFVMPNIPIAGDMEGFGVVMLEAGLCGLPSVAARMEGVADVLRNGVSGYYVNPKDAKAFVQIIERLDSERAALRTLKRTTPRYVRDTFSWSTVADRFVGIFRQLTDDRRAGG